LLAAASFIPFLHGLYSPRATQRGALVASLVGLIIGLAYFPMLRGLIAEIPVVEALLPTPSFLWSFLGATVVSGLLTTVFAHMADTRFDLDTLAHEIQTLEDPAPDGGNRLDGGGREV
jgi:Na+/proline symporter